MSLVERALKKMQAAKPANPRAVAAGSQGETFGKVVVAADIPEAVPRRVVAINQTALRAAGLLPPEHQGRQIAQQYRQIKRPIIANALGRGVAPLPDGHLIMMASAMPGEGKTFTSINLAFSMALEKDISVLLVDADVPKPHISRLFGLEDEPGLLDLLQDPKRDIESLILPTDVPGLSVLPAGQPSEHATELLASDRMHEIVAAIGSHDSRRIVLFDSPPLLLTTESQVLVQWVGQVVVVVRAEITSQSIVLDALSYLQEGKSIALVLNQSVAAASTGYYYGYSESRTPAS